MRYIAIIFSAIFLVGCGGPEVDLDNYQDSLVKVYESIEDPVKKEQFKVARDVLEARCSSKVMDKDDSVHNGYSLTALRPEQLERYCSHLDGLSADEYISLAQERTFNDLNEIHGEDDYKSYWDLQDD